MAKKERFATTPDIAALQGDDHYKANGLLREWLSDDEHRQELYRLINEAGGEIEFWSRDVAEPDCECLGVLEPRPVPTTGHRRVRLVTGRDRIEGALGQERSRYSSRAYAELGGGSFMLALDPQTAAAHGEQRDFYRACFPGARDADSIMGLAEAACQAAAIMSLRAPEFDLAAFAEQAALRFCQKLMGYASTDFRLLEGSLRAAYRGLVYQVLGRHFASDPMAIPEAKQAMGKLLARTSALIDAYATNDKDGLKGCDDPAGLPQAQRVLSRLAHGGGGLNGEQRAILAVGAAVGTVGNVQAAVCIAVRALFEDPATLQAVQGLARSTTKSEDRLKRAKELWSWIVDALADNPPIPFLPRVLRDDDGRGVREVLLALGGATQRTNGPDPLIWGMPGSSPHACAGEALAWPLVTAIVRHVLALPGLAQTLDPEDASVKGLKKRWGFACESYPLTHQRERRVHQSSLNVAMRLKSPVRDSADRVREVIRSGAPRIEEALRSSRHVHFAWFELVEGETVLVLHTVYDGPFTAYIQHFALKVGDVFDALFECIENPPPMPVDKFPNEFVAHIQRYDRPPAMGYFFSAYPGAEVAHILRDDRANP